MNDYENILSNFGETNCIFLDCTKPTYYQNTCVELSRNTGWRINCAGKELTCKKSSKTLRSNLPFGEVFVEQRSTANYYTPYKFSGKEKDEETSYSYFGARYYLSDISIWASVDPMAAKYPNTSPYMYCAGNPVLLVDPNGKEWIITGSKSKEAFNRYQSATSLKLSMDPSGKVHVVGSPWIVWRRSDRMLKRMINDQKVTVHLIANDNNMTSAGISSRSGGAYMGNTVTKDASGKVQHVDAYQEINEPLLEKIEGEIGNAGVLIKHEAFEAFMGALIAEKSGISSPNASVATSTYNDAHDKANRYAYGNIKIIDIPTISLRPNTDPATRSIMPYIVVNSTKKVYRSDD